MGTPPPMLHGPSGEPPALGYDPTTLNTLVGLKVTNVTQDPVTNQWYGTLAISTASLPLPTGAAKESGGNLDAINTATAGAKTDLDTLNSTTGATTDGAWDGISNTSSETQIQRAIYNKINSTTNNSVDMLYNGGSPNAQNYDRLRSVQANNASAPQSLTTTAHGDMSLSFSVAPTGLQNSAPITLYGSGTEEEVYTADNYTPGNNPVALRSPGVQNAGQTTAIFGLNSTRGPKTNGFLLYGAPHQAPALWDNANNLYRQAQSDAQGYQFVAVRKPLSALLFSTTQTGVTTWSGSGDIDASNYTELLIHINVTSFSGGSSPSWIFKPQRKDSFGAYYTLQSSNSFTATGSQPMSVGAGLSGNHALGIIKVSATVVSNATLTFTLDVYGK